MSSDHGHGNRILERKPELNPPVVRKVPADSVPYGENISRNGRFVWVGIEDGRIVCVAATADQCRAKVRTRAKGWLKNKGKGIPPQILSLDSNTTAATPLFI